MVKLVIVKVLGNAFHSNYKNSVFNFTLFFIFVELGMEQLVVISAMKIVIKTEIVYHLVLVIATKVKQFS